VSTAAAYELVRQHNRYHQGAQDDSCPFCAFERMRRQKRTEALAMETKDH